MTLSLQPVRIAGVEGGDGRLVFIDDALVAVLVRLSEIQDEAAGRWFVEAGFGRLDGVTPTPFQDLQSAERWIEARLVSS